MSVDVKRLPESQVELEITVEPAEIQGAMDKAYSRLANQVAIPGFRKGRAPRAMVERVVGPAAVFQEAVEIAVGEAYERALTEHQLQPLTQPQIRYVLAAALGAHSAVPPTEPAGTLADEAEWAGTAHSENSR